MKALDSYKDFIEPLEVSPTIYRSTSNINACGLSHELPHLWLWILKNDAATFLNFLSLKID